MLPPPRAHGAVARPQPPAWSDIDDDDGWQDMPVVRSNDFTSDLDAIDDKRYHYRPPERLDEGAGAAMGNATGAHLELASDTLITDSWREKTGVDESDYTRLRLEEDEESEEVHMRTRYLFDEGKAMTPLSQMQATKNLLTDAQRIAYVGLCQLVARRMLRDMGRGWDGTKAKANLLKRAKGKGHHQDVPPVESGKIWMIKIMARLYQHMELEREEQIMIESLADHGVDPADLVPALMTTHTVKNPEFDPAAKKRAEQEAKEKAAKEQEDKEKAEREQEEGQKAKEAEASADATSHADTLAGDDDPAPPYEEAIASPPASHEPPTPPASTSPASALPSGPSVPQQGGLRAMPSLFDDDDDDALPVSPPPRSNSGRGSLRPMPSLFDDDGDDGDIGGSLPPSRKQTLDDDEGDIGDIGAVSSPREGHSDASTPKPTDSQPPGSPAKSAVETPSTEAPAAETPTEAPAAEAPAEASTTDADLTTPLDRAVSNVTPKLEQGQFDGDPHALEEAPMPSLPGVSLSITAADEDVTLDIRWTVMCDLFLVLVADSVYDARSRAFLERIANALGFAWLDVVRFENRVTDALEIQEGVEQLQPGEVIEEQRKRRRNKRYAMVGAAAVGGALVIGLSAGLLAPLIGAGMAAVLAPMGVTAPFLTGIGGAAVITSTGVVTGANIAGKGMSKRTREVRTFELKPLHNNKRVSCYITVGGFMSSKVDDVRLPFSVLDSMIGDVFSVLWEPEMMNELGTAMKIIGTEVLTQVGQQILAATLMTALMSALQVPMILSKLGYLIDNPWSNALDRAKAAGLVLADVLIQRHAGVRPTSLIGFSLGARVIFYALAELARQGAYGIVQDVYLFGATLTAPRQTWLEARSVVGGRFVNAFSSNDWMLGYLFRATTGGLNTVAGLRPVETVPGLENIDVTDSITGHMAYRSSMPVLLSKVGFPVTAEYFDEPDDPDADQTVNERTIVLEGEAEEEMIKKQKKILGIFPRSKGKSAAGSGRTSGAATPRVSQAQEKEDGDDELPPREGQPRGSGGSGDYEVDLGERPSRQSVDTVASEDAALRSIPKTAGFDFAAISRELGKDIDLDKLKDPSRLDQLPPSASQPQVVVVPPAPERAESAPPPAPPSPSPSEQQRPASPARSQSAAPGVGIPIDDDGDIAVEASKALSLDRDRASVDASGDMPAWDRTWSSSSTHSASPSLSASSAKAPSIFGFNAWSTPAPVHHPPSGSFDANGMRAAPPARPHPPEFMANPFAMPSMPSSASMAPPTQARRNTDERLALENPW